MDRDALLALLLIAGSVLAMQAWLIRGKRRRTAALRMAALHLGMVFRAKDDSVLESPMADLPLFQPGFRRRVTNVIHGESIGVFDYTFERWGEESSQVQTVAAIRLKGRPLTSFRLAPRDVLDGIRSLFGGEDLEFEEAPDFSNDYRLRGANAEEVRALFTIELRHLLVIGRGWSLEGRDDWLIAYRKHRLVAPDHLSEFLQHARQIFEIFERR